MKSKLSKAVKELLGEEGARIIDDPSFMAPNRGKLVDYSKFRDADLVEGIRGCFVGTALVVADLRYMMQRAQALLDELYARGAIEDAKGADAPLEALEEGGANAEGE